MKSNKRKLDFSSFNTNRIEMLWPIYKWIYQNMRGCVLITQQNSQKFEFWQILLGDENATYLCSKIISTLQQTK